MKILIKDDVFEIDKRLKEIDENYFILYDTEKQKYEVHNCLQETTYCLTVPFDGLDSRLVDFVCLTNVANIDNIVRDIDNSNCKHEINCLDNVKNYTDYMLREIYDFYSNSSKNFCNNSYSIVWR